MEKMLGIKIKPKKIIKFWFSKKIQKKYFSNKFYFIFFFYFFQLKKFWIELDYYNFMEFRLKY
jgi:hypothetical protein